MKDGTNNQAKSTLDYGKVKASFMKTFAKDNPWRLVNLACTLFLITGYLFYFAAYFLPTPQWGRELMMWAMPTVQALDSAARVGAIKGTDPFPAQVVILYCAWGAILLTLWYVYAGTCNARLQRKILCDHRSKYQKIPHKKRPSRILFFLAGVVLLIAAVFILYVTLWFTVTNLVWQNFQFHSSSISSVSFLLFVAVIAPLYVIFSPAMFYLSLFSNTFFEKD